MRPQKRMDLPYGEGNFSLGSFHGKRLTSDFGASIADSMATVYGCAGMSSGSTRI